MYHSATFCSMQSNDNAHKHTYTLQMLADSPISKNLCLPNLGDPAVLIYSLNNQNTQAYLEQHTYFYVSGFNDKGHPCYERQRGSNKQDYMTPLIFSSEKNGSREKLTLEIIFPLAVHYLNLATNGATGSFKYQHVKSTGLKSQYHELSFNESDL